MYFNVKSFIGGCSVFSKLLNRCVGIFSGEMFSPFSSLALDLFFQIEINVEYSADMVSNRSTDSKTINV